jgi:hypothetical protein
MALENSTTDVSFVPWNASEYPLRSREIVDIRWGARPGLQIDIAEAFGKPPSMQITFTQVYAFEGIDEGYRLRDTAVGTALIYSRNNSPYIARFRENAAHTMDRMPMTHWLVISANQCIDVLSEVEPKLTFLDAC